MPCGADSVTGRLRPTSGSAPSADPNCEMLVAECESEGGCTVCYEGLRALFF